MKTIERSAMFLLAGVVTAVALTGSSCGDGTPVVEAGPDANTAPAQTFVEPCNKFGQSETVVGQNIVYAEHEFNGLKLADIAARVNVVGPAWITTSSYKLMLRTEFHDGNPFSMMLVRDGAAAVVCGTPNALNFESVTFVFR